jgi:hypothetical protein
MSNYKQPIQIRIDDPICSVTAIGNSVIGVLFDKPGSEIRTAIRKRIYTIDDRVKECKGVIGSVQGFLKTKEDQIKELESLRTAREDEKKAVLRPLERDIEKICNQIREKNFFHNAETEKRVAERAAAFDDRFEDYKNVFKEIDTFLEQEHNENVIYAMSFHGSGGPCGLDGLQGWEGVQGAQGFQGSQGSWGKASKEDAEGIVREITSDEEKALARLQTLKGVVLTYTGRVNHINAMILRLEEEKRRLSLIERNLDDKRSYKLDLNKLSAFGFEDVETV